MSREAGSFVSEISGKRNAMKTDLASSTIHFITTPERTKQRGPLSTPSQGDHHQKVDRIKLAKSRILISAVPFHQCHPIFAQHSWIMLMIVIVGISLTAGSFKRRKIKMTMILTMMTAIPSLTMERLKIKMKKKVFLAMKNTTKKKMPSHFIRYFERIKVAHAIQYQW